jgi:hypothetical protein
MSVMDEVAVFDIPFTDLEERIVGWVREALDLRHGTAEDPDGTLAGILEVEHPDEAVHALRRVVARIDRLDRLMASVTQARGRAKRAEDQAKFVADQAYDEATRLNAANRRAEFITAKERHADAALDSLEQRRIAHHAARLVSITAEAYEVVNQVHWQLDGLRKDLRTILHALQFERSLER